MDKKIERVITDFEKQTGLKPLGSYPESINFMKDITSLFVKYISKYNKDVTHKCLTAVSDILEENGFNKFYF